MRECRMAIGFAAHAYAAAVNSFFFPGVLIGPSTRFVDYRAWSRNTLYGGSPSAAPRTPPNGRVRAGITELVLGFAFMGVWAVLAADYNYEALLLPKGEPGSALDRSLLSRIWITNVAGLVARTKYYGIWGLANVSAAESAAGSVGTPLTRAAGRLRALGPGVQRPRARKGLGVGRGVALALGPLPQH